ncbi:MAG: hypothetical protein ABW224_16185 [Kibdelosporangium sp.]
MNYEAPVLRMSYIGGPESGKTTAIIGGSIALAKQFGSEFRAPAVDPEQRAFFSNSWDMLKRTGEFPLPTAGDKTVEYELMLRRLNQPVVPISVVDYRGGIVKAAEKNSYGPLSEHFAKCASLNVVMNGLDVVDFFRGESDPEDIGRVAEGVLDDVYEQRDSLPPICVQVTKADLLVGLAETPEERRAKLIGLARASFPSLFTEQTTTVVVPTSVYDFDEKVYPLNMEVPYLFGLDHYLRRHGDALEENATALRDTVAELGQKLAQREQLPAFQRFLGYFSTVRTRHRMARTEATRTEVAGRHTWISEAQEAIAKEMSAWPVWREGNWSGDAVV